MFIAFKTAPFAGVLSAMISCPPHNMVLPAGKINVAKSAIPRERIRRVLQTSLPGTGAAVDPAPEWTVKPDCGASAILTPPEDHLAKPTQLSPGGTESVTGGFFADMPIKTAALMLVVIGLVAWFSPVIADTAPGGDVPLSRQSSLSTPSAFGPGAF